MLWHQRLGNIGEKGLQILNGNGTSNCSLYFDFCENCVYEKQNRVSFPSGAKRVKGILEFVHSDVFGPVSVPSLGKSVYYVSVGTPNPTWVGVECKKSQWSPSDLGM